MMTSDLYAELLLDAAKHPAHFGLLPEYSVSSQQYNASCGDQIVVTLQLEDQIIAAVGWQGEGCVISKAHMSALSELIIGKTVSEVLAMTKQDQLDLFGFDETLSPGREKCLMIGLRAVQAALASFKNSN